MDRFDSSKSVESPFGGGQFDGDFYNDRQDTTRGVSMATPSMGGRKMDTDFGAGGFFYMEADDYFKDQSKGLGFAPPPLSGLLGAGKEHSDKDVAASPELTRFTVTFKVPTLPGDPFFALAPTTFRVVVPPKASPHDIGNVFLDFLASEGMEATLIKVRPQKYWASANVFLESSMVRVKARVYHQEDGDHYPVELQRRTGCAVTFVKIYKQALAFFHRSNFRVLDGTGQGVAEAGEPLDPFGLPPPLPLAGLSGVVDFAAPPPPPLLGGDFEAPPPPQLLGAPKDLAPFAPMPLAFGGLDSFSAVGSSVSPLYSMMQITDNPSMQAEAFSSLADIARDQPDQFATDAFVTGIKNLLTGRFPNDAEAEYGLARLLAKVMESAEVSQRLARDGALIWIADKVYAEMGMGVSAKRQLARALAEAAKNLSSSASQEHGTIMKELEAALPMDGTMDGRVQELLKQARDMLKGGRA